MSTITADAWTAPHMTAADRRILAREDSRTVAYVPTQRTGRVTVIASAAPAVVRHVEPVGAARIVRTAVRATFWTVVAAAVVIVPQAVASAWATDAAALVRP